MNKLLIIANLHHASPRIPGIASYLHKYGWIVTVVSPVIYNKESFNFPKNFLQKVSLVETNYSGDIWQIWRNILKKFNYRVNKSGYQSGLVSQIKQGFRIKRKKSLIELAMNLYRFLILAFPDDEKKWKKTVMETSGKLIEKERFNVILSSSPYPTSHWIASELKKKYKLPWIADFRDTWSQNHDYPYGKIRKWIDTKLEKRIMSNVDLMIAATPEIAKKQTILHGKETLVLTNGFDAESETEHSEPISTSASQKLTIIYTGSIYQDKQDPEKLFSVLGKLIKERKINPEELEVCFYGPPVSWLGDLIARHGLGGIVQEKGMVSRKDSFRKQREAQVLLLLNWDDPSERGIYPTKFFEYLSARRPILATGGYAGDDVQTMMAQTKSGVYAITESEIELALLDFWNKFKRYGKVFCESDWNEISKYSYENLAKQLSYIMERFVV